MQVIFVTFMQNSLVERQLLYLFAAERQKSHNAGALDSGRYIALMLGAKSGCAARQNLAVFGGVLFKAFDVLIVDVVDMALAVFANAFFGGTACASYLVVAVCGFEFIFGLVHD